MSLSDFIQPLSLAGIIVLVKLIWTMDRRILRIETQLKLNEKE
jgi:hypothetical protein